MFRFEKQRVAARKRLLNRVDVIRFDTVPNFIINSFFGSCTYKSRLITTTFAVLNGISIDGFFDLIRWSDFSDREKAKVIALFLDYEKPHYRNRYYSYNVHYKLVMYLNGDIRRMGQRVISNNQ